MTFTVKLISRNNFVNSTLCAASIILIQNQNFFREVEEQFRFRSDKYSVKLKHFVEHESPNGT